MKWVKFLKNYDTHKEGDLLQVEDDLFTKLIELKIAEETTSPESETVKEVVSQLNKQIQDSIQAGIDQCMKDLGSNLKLKLPAIPRDADEEGRGGFKNQNEFVVSLINASRPTNPIVDKRLKHVHDSELSKAPSGLNTRDDVDGGYLIPETFAAGIWERITETQTLMSRCDNRQTSGNNLKINAFDENSRKDGYRDGGVLAYWTGEAESYTSSQPRWRRLGMELHKITVLMYATEEEIADAAISIGSVFSNKAAKAIDFKVNEAFIWGTGVGMPQGIMRSTALIEVPIEYNQNADTILHKNINKMYHRMHPSLRSGAIWLVHPNLEEQLEYISFLDAGTSTNSGNTNQIPIYLPPGGLTASPFGTLKGRPVIPFEYMKDFGAKGDIVFANFSQYATLTKTGGGTKQAVSMHVRFLFDELAFKFSFRVDGQSLWPAPLEDYNGTTTRSPFVTLAARDTVSSSSGV